MRLTRTVMQTAGRSVRCNERSARSPSPWWMLALVMAPILAGSACAAEQKGLLETIKRHSIVTSTVPANGDQNPYAIVVAPVSAGKIQKDDVLVDNFNDRNNLQGLGTTIVDYNPATKKLTLFAAIPRNLPQCPGWRGPDHGDDHAEIRLGHRRQPAEPGRHHQDEGPGLPDRARTPKATSRASSPARTSTGRGATWR